MTWNDSPGDSFEPAHSASGVFNAAGVQVKGTCGSSFITDVLKIERNGIENAVKVLSESAAQDPEIVSRFLTNARYNQALNEFTGMNIIEISEAGPRPYSVFDRVAQSSLLEVIRHHAPIDPLWLINLLLPVARMLDTIHQRNVLHANLKPSNILIVVENGKENFKLVDFLDPSLSSTSATITGAGVYAAPEFRAGMPVSNRSDIYSLSSIIYEAFTGYPSSGAHRSADGSFHVWRNADQPRELTQLNPEVERELSDIIMGGISPQAIARPASASSLIEDSLRILERPKARHKPVEKPVEHTPVPMLLIGLGVFVATILVLFVGFKIASSLFGSDGPSNPTTTPATTEQVNPNATENELALLRKLPVAQQDCLPITKNADENPWNSSVATLNCSLENLSLLQYGLFKSESALNSEYIKVESAFEATVTNAGQSMGVTPSGAAPCATSPNEKGEWNGPNDSGGQFICINTPYPRIVWTETKSKIIGMAEMRNGTVADLGSWWAKDSGPVL